MDASTATSLRYQEDFLCCRSFRGLVVCPLDANVRMEYDYCGASAIVPIGGLCGTRAPELGVWDQVLHESCRYGLRYGGAVGEPLHCCIE